MDKSVIERLLTGKSLRITKPRLALLRCFGSGEQALTFNQIRKAVGIQIDRVSIYRILHRLTEKDIVLRQHDNSGTGFYILNLFGDFNIQVTPLLRCSSCNKVSALPELPLFYAEVLRENHLNSHPIFNGQCKGCYHG